MHALRWTWYLLRLALYLGGAGLRLLSRRNVRVSGVLAIAALGYFQHDEIERLILRQVRTFASGYQPEPWLLIAGTVFVTFVGCLTFSIVTGIIATTMSSFRIGRRPLRPARRLKATNAKISPAVVKIVVPPLPKRMKV